MNIVLRATINLLVKTESTQRMVDEEVLLLIKNSINYVQIIPDNSIDYTNSVWIEVVNSDGKKTVIGVVYRSPNSTETNNEKLYKFIQELSNRNLVISSDFNYPNIDWNNLHTTHDGSDFMNLIMDNFLCQHVNFPTRVNNILDLFISSDPNMVDNLQCVGKLGSRDHVLVLAELNFKTCVAKNLQEIPDWKKANMDRIKDSLNIDGSRNWKGRTHFQAGMNLSHYLITALTIMYL